MSREDEIRLRHMVDAAREAASFAVGRTRGDLDADRQLVMALVKEIEIVGEASASGSSTRSRSAWRICGDDFRCALHDSSPPHDADDPSSRPSGLGPNTAYTHRDTLPETRIGGLFFLSSGTPRADSERQVDEARSREDRTWSGGLMGTNMPAGNR